MPDCLHKNGLKQEGKWTMPCEFALDLCFIREHTQSPLQTVIDQQLHGLFVGKGTWYIDHREEEGLDIVVAEVKGLATWETEDDILRYIEESVETDVASESDCWDYLLAYQVKVSPKLDAGCCRIKTR
ncbi:hypothetical protein GK047_07350 [Paenibacillus sp. SYP-B3998]|uniref:Uncharacterized protein n=1 Tax=Paenibacillus sp. SYP-B3998 TaxID=2678564 RepID=A0A6G3ZUE7_9BACL|nr:hypothetical protein [Paenibacillus sp. SYP-B3998]NEW05833.1 hypothetical protein [Paenibacillus sp. SYP-B3998]